MSLWETVVVGLVEIASLTGPILLVHHKRIGAVLTAINSILSAATEQAQEK